MFSWQVIIISLSYLLILFGIGLLAEKFRKKGKSLVTNPFVYALSLAVYCTAWTFYGSVERAAEGGLDFLTIYIGPALIMPLWLLLLKKIIRICKVQRITSLSDFIATRYGKKSIFGGIVAFLFLISIIPYISIQIKAISHSFDILANTQTQDTYDTFWNDTALLFTFILALFTIIFGTRKLDTTERHEGMVLAVAFESLFKLVVFLAIGAYVTYGVFNGFGDIFNQVDPNSLIPHSEISSNENSQNWTWLLVASSLAFILLPRQFQTSVKENVEEKYLSKAAWMFPLYLFLINLFVIPLAMGGFILFADGSIKPSDFVLAIPLHFNANFLAILGYLGGFSAATSMIIVSTIALSTMVSNSIVMPLIAQTSLKSISFENNIRRILLMVRRSAIIGILLLSYVYFKYLSESAPLFSIGLISFVAVAQFAPAVIGGVLWKNANYFGAFTGLIVGFSIWGITLIVPTIIEAGWLSESILQNGLLGIEFLKPNNLFGLSDLGYIQHSLFWSLGLNTFCFVIISLSTKQSVKEHNEAEVFVDIFKYSEVYESSIVWKGHAKLTDIVSLLSNFWGTTKSNLMLNAYLTKNAIPATPVITDSRMFNFVENQLAGVVGKSSARLLLYSILKEDEFSFDEVFEILQESRQLRSFNLELKEKSKALEKARQELVKVNQDLRSLDSLKDEFISTVTHEMRTPITSIKAFAEILQDNPDLEDQEQSHFVETIIKESERMERLINQVLDIEKFDSGKQRLNLKETKINTIIKRATEVTAQLIEEKNIKLVLSLQESLPTIAIDRDRITQVLLNLISNAIKFCNTQNGKITISTYYLDGNVRINVTDNGKGIEPNEIELIFNSFYQAKDQNYKKPVGSGLGLTISKKIIELHEGSLKAESIPNVETKFSVTLPIRTELLYKPYEYTTKNIDS